MAKLYRLHVRMPNEAEPRDFEATVTDDNGWAVHGVADQEAADATAGFLAGVATDYAGQVNAYLPDPGRLWAEAILLAFPSSELLSAPPIVSESDPDDQGGDARVY